MTQGRKELLRLGLTPGVRGTLVLTTELASRGIGGDARLEAVRHEDAEGKAQNDRELEHQVLVLE